MTHALARRAYAETPAGQLHYRESGDPGGVPLVLLHQTASSSVQWAARVLPLLPAGIRAIALDTPGFGLSDPPPRPSPGMPWYAGRVRDLLDALGIERAHLAGHHTGAMIALEVAAAHPERVASVSAIGCVVLDRPEDAAPFRDSMVKWQADAGGAFVTDVLLPRMALSVQAGGGAAEAEHLLLELTAYLEAGPDYWWAYEAVYGYAAPERLPLVAAPTQCVACLREPQLLVDWTRRAAELVPGARLVELDAGTEACFTEPAEIAGFVGHGSGAARGAGAAARVAAPEGAGR